MCFAAILIRKALIMVHKESAPIYESLNAALIIVLLLAGCTTTPASPGSMEKFQADQLSCHETGKLMYFGKDLSNLSKAECDEKVNRMAKELDRWYDPAYEAAKKAMEDNDKRARRIMDAYLIVQKERVKAKEISEERAKAEIQLKLEEVIADMNRANSVISDSYARRNSRGRSFTCMTTGSSNSAFTMCN